MIQVRPSSERGTFDHGWLVTRHTFSFDQYRDPRYVGFSDLRVINEDDVAPGKGFGTHPHWDMEIVTYVVKGTIAHRDTMGNVTEVKAGEIQVMSAGTGIEHSEFNPSPSQPVKLLQIWLKVAEKGLPPAYAQKALDPRALSDRWELLVSPDGNALPIRQDARVFATRLAPGQERIHELAAGRQAWVQIVSGSAKLNGTTLSEGDGASATDERKLILTADAPTEALLFDLR